ncbi:hypothetical protein GN958_ATG09463 [Phytophthora infestans]|uniref:Uncharacterized protein n=1 Tax=Phytophthora infestans TaxID=4787 RepID=A0A8S9UPC5_PHYIN|nr:hypothetical protein GN958_ATG09463 [Phytophthora infestans]
MTRVLRRWATINSEFHVLSMSRYHWLLVGHWHHQQTQLMADAIPSSGIARFASQYVAVFTSSKIYGRMKKKKNTPLKKHKAIDLTSKLLRLQMG